MEKKNIKFSNNIGFLLKINDLTQEEFAEKIGKRKSIIGAYMSGSALPRVDALMDISNYFGISIDELLNVDIETKGKENATILKVEKETKSKENATVRNGSKNGSLLEKNEKYTKCDPFSDQVKEFRLATDSIRQEQIIPLYNIEATAGLVPLFTSQEHQTTEGFISIPNLPKCDGAIHVTGDSMYPLLKSGDIVLYKQINDIANNIFWGEMYLISVDMEGEEYVTVKYIQRSEQENYIRLVSHNQHHSDKEVPISKVVALAFVKASIRINSMK